MTPQKETKREPRKERRALWATETRLQAVISNWFEDQASGELPKETLARRVLDSLVIMPDEFFEYVENIVRKP